MSLLHQASLLFGLRSGSTFTPAPSLKPLLDGISALQVPGPETVWAVGEVDLGQSVRLVRFYLDNQDYWLQVLMNGAEPGDIVLFGYHSAVAVNDQEHLQSLTGSAPKAGMPIFEHEGNLYSRQWGREAGSPNGLRCARRLPAPKHGTASSTCACSMPVTPVCRTGANLCCCRSKKMSTVRSPTPPRWV